MSLLVAWPGCEGIAQALGRALGAAPLAFETRRFPDGEAYLRLAAACKGRKVTVVASLDRPDEKALPLFFLADCLRAEGAASVGLIAPYLAYLRQDRQFNAGEAVTSRTFGRLASGAFSWLVTVDPHLHRYKSLDEIYSIPSRVAHAAPAIARWIEKNVKEPLLIGPDSESAQWVSDIARRINAPWTTLEKTRHGDRDVEVSIPHVEKWRSRTPVLADDIISTGRTMIAAIRRLRDEKTAAPVCVGVHAIFAGDAYEAMRAAGAARIATCNTISHASNDIDVSELMADKARELIG